MYINVENLNELCERHPELEIVRNVTGNHGVESEISLLCELIAKVYQKLDLLTPSKSVLTPDEEGPVVANARRK